MRFLVVGLGSMGKRRIRNLNALGFSEICGVDKRSDRCEEAQSKYSISLYADVETAISDFRPTAIVISTSPESHLDIAEFALRHRVPAFIEASVVDAEGVKSLDERSRQFGTLFYPSCTMRYFPGPKSIKRLISDGRIGRPLCISYHTGQYLPDWHPWEDISDYYVSKRDTGGCREIVPFELTWINEIFGDPAPLYCLREKLADFDAEIDDYYHCVLRYPGNLLLNMTVEVISRPVPSREMRIIGTSGELQFSVDHNVIRLATTDTPEWQEYQLQKGESEEGYINPEGPYIDEMRDFVQAVSEKRPEYFSNTLENDYRILELLNGLENISTR